jgi:hypothetical protein
MPPGDDEEPARALDGRVSRRRLLSKAGAAAVAAVAAGTLLNPREAKANHFGDGLFVDWVHTHFTEVDAIAVKGEAPNGFGVMGLGQRGVLGQGSSDVGVRGLGVGGVIGVHGQSQSGDGVLGNGKVGVHGIGDTGHGVLGEGNGIDETAGVRGTGRTGVWGSTGVTGYSGVYGQHTGSFGYGLVGDGRGSSGAGVLGRNNNSSGVRGEGVNGVHGKATSGYGGLFEGGKAQLKMVPKGSVGKPTSGAHTKGEVYMDSAGALFVCTAGGTPGTWRKVTTTAA